MSIEMRKNKRNMFLFFCFLNKKNSKMKKVINKKKIILKKVFQISKKRKIAFLFFEI